MKKKRQTTNYQERRIKRYLGLVLGVVSVFILSLAATVVHALTLPTGAKQVGTINNAPVVESKTNDTSSQHFKDIISALLEGIDTPPYVVDQVAWNSKTSLFNGKNISSFGQSPTAVFGADGFDPTDKAILLNLGDVAYIQDVGTALDTKTGEKIPLALGVTFQGAKGPGNTPLNKVLMGAKSQNTVVTLAWGSPTSVGEGGGGSTEGGGIEGGTNDGTGFFFIEEINYMLTLINSKTGATLPNNTLMPIKISDIDASQLATMGGQGAKGYILSPNSALSQSGNGFKSNSDGALIEDTINLSTNSYIVLKQYNTNSVQFQYTNGKNDYLDIVTGQFGSTPWDLSDLLGGFIEIDKSTVQFGKDLWNDKYNFTSLSFDVVDKNGKVVDTIKLDAKGKGKSKRIPQGTYTLKEKSSNWTSSGQTVNADQTTNVPAGDTVIVKPKNKAVRGKITINKSLDNGYNKELPNQLYRFEGLQYQVTSKDGKFKDTVTLDKTGNATTKELPLGIYTVQEIESSVTKETGQVVNPKVYEVELKYANQTTEIVASTSEVTNTPVLGQITIEKSGVESGKDMWNQHYSLAGNVFRLTSKTDGKTYEITTNEKGIAKTDDKMPLGIYDIEEIKAGPGFVNTFKKKTVELTWKDNQTKVVFAETEGDNQEIKGESRLEKEDKETGKESQGKAVLQEAEYGLFYAEDATGSSPHKKGQAVKWADIPKATLLKGSKVTSSIINGSEVKHGDNVVIKVDDKELSVAVGNLALGKYEWRELNAPVGYAADKTVYPFELTKKDDHTPNIVADTIISKEPLIKAKLPIQKLAEIEGESAESGYNGVEFTATPLEGTNGKPVTVKTGVNPQTDEDGYAEFLLPYGDYVIEETKGIEGFDDIKPIYIHMTTDVKKDLLTISASMNKDFSKPFSKRVFSLSDNVVAENPNAGEAVGIVSYDKPIISLSKMTFTDKDVPVIETDPIKDVTKTDGGVSIDKGDVALSSDFVYSLKSSELSAKRVKETEKWTIVDDYDENFDQFKGTFKVYAANDFGKFKKGDVLPEDYFKAEDKDGKVTFEATSSFLSVINKLMKETISFEIRADFYRHTYNEAIKNVFVEHINDEEKISNIVETNTPKPEPHKFNVSEKNFDLTGDKLLDDDSELEDRYKDTNENPYSDKVENNEKENLNTKLVNPGDSIIYQLWLDTRPYDNTSQLTKLGMVDIFDHTQLKTNLKRIKVYDYKGKNVTEYFDIAIKDNELTVFANAFKEVVNAEGEKVQVVDTEKLPLGHFYKVEFPTTVKEEADREKDIINTANQITVDSLSKEIILPTEKRVNPLDKGEKPKKDVVKVDEGESIDGKDVALNSNFIYKLHSRILSAGRTDDVTEWQIVDDYDETFDRYNESYRVFSATEFGEYKVGDQLPEDFFKAEEKDGKVTFTAQEPFFDVIDENKAQTVGFVIHADFYRFKDSKEVVNTFVESVNKVVEKSNEVKTKTPMIEPHKFDLSQEKYDLQGDKLLADDKEMEDRYKESNENPYADDPKNNQKENINTLKVKNGQKIVYQLWLDTRAFDTTSLLTQLQMVDSYDKNALTVDTKQVKVYDNEGKDVTEHFTVTDKEGKLTISASSLVESTNRKGEKVNIIDTSKLTLGQYYKIDVPATVKKEVKEGTEIINVANQEWKDIDDTEGKHITEKRVNKVEKPSLPTTPKEVLQKVLPQTGDSPSTLAIKVIGWLLVSSTGIILYRRRQQRLALEGLFEDDSKPTDE